MNHKNQIFISGLLLFTLACGAASSFPPPDPTSIFTQTPPVESTAAPTPAALPTQSAQAGAPSISEQVKLGFSQITETGNAPAYVITAQAPELQGLADPRVAQFNLLMRLLVEYEVNRFRADVLASQPVTPLANGSSLDIQYTLVGQRGDVWSIKLDAYVYMDGAAHPTSYSITFNYDLAAGRELRLGDLFNNDAYLQTISDFCKAELSARDIGFSDPLWQSGAAPLEENYKRWNLSDEGLVITFDVYQVAPYAAGPQTVIVPYEALRGMANPGGAISVFDR